MSQADLDPNTEFSNILHEFWCIQEILKHLSLPDENLSPACYAWIAEKLQTAIDGLDEWNVAHYRAGEAA